MHVCRACGLAQLAADDDTIADERVASEPQALKDQGKAAIYQVAASGWLRGIPSSSSAARMAAIFVSEHNR